VARGCRKTRAFDLRPEYQGQGIGKAVLDYLDEQYPDRVEVIELGLHRSNARALTLYRKTGFMTVKSLDGLGFYVMQIGKGRSEGCQ